MKVENLKRQGNLVTFEVEDEYPKLEAAMDKKYKELSVKTKIPGFRPGKAPKGHFLNHYGFARLSYEAMMDLINEQYPHLIDEQKIDVIDYPTDVQVIQLEENKPFKVQISVEVKPNINIKNYKGIKLEKEAVKVEKDDVAKEIQQFIDSHATFEEKADAVIVTENIVTVDLSATLEGQPYPLWTKENDVFKVGSGVISKEYDDQLIGLKVGDEKSFDISFPPEGTLNKDVAGKAVSFQVKVKTIKVKTTPKLDDEFIAGKTQQKTVEEYRKHVEEHLKEHKEKDADNKLRSDLADWLVGEVKEEIPDAMVRKEVDYMIRRMEMNLRQYNLELGAYLQMTQKTIDDLRNDYRSEAVKSVKYRMCLDAIAKAENIVVTDDDINKEIEDSVKNETDEEKKNEYRQQMNSMKDVISENILHSKVIDYLLDNAKIKKK